MKKVYVILAVAAMTLCAASCGNNKKAAKEGECCGSKECTECAAAETKTATDEVKEAAVQAANEVKDAATEAAKDAAVNAINDAAAAAKDAIKK